MKKQGGVQPSEIRIDYIHDRSVIIAPGRSKRPHDFETHSMPSGIPASECVFCRGNLEKVKALDVVGPRKKWQLISLKNVFPVVSPDFPKAYGHQEVIVETPDHDVELAELPVEQFEKLIALYAKRTNALSADKKIRYILIFKNNGGRAGASINHAHSQVFASTFLPPHIQDKLTRAQEYRIRYGRCYYCDLWRKEVKGPRRIINDGTFTAFAPYASSYNYEAWLISKRHVDNVEQLTGEERRDMAKMLKRLLERLAVAKIPYNFYLHQDIVYPDEHFYLRIAPRRDVWAGLELGSRLIVNTVAPEEAARFYREIKTIKKTG